MKTIQFNSSLKVQVADFTFPDNLTRLVSPGELVQWTLEAVQTFLWSNRPGAPTPAAAGVFNPRVMLTVLTYSYATGNFGSASVVVGIERDPALSYLGMGIRFTADRIRLFRGQNMEVVRRSLAFVLRRVYDRCVSSPNALAQPAETAGWNSVLSQQDAQWRLQRALQADASAGASGNAFELPIRSRAVQI
jgi:hypothetical protein